MIRIFFASVLDFNIVDDKIIHQVVCVVKPEGGCVFYRCISISGQFFGQAVYD